MDIKASLEKSKKRKLKWLPYVTLSIVFILVIYLLQHKEPNLYFDELRLATVQKGDLELSVSGYGQLRSKFRRQITTGFSAQVAEVVHLPGSRVEKETIILRLSNPELEQQLNRERLALGRQKANLEALKLSQRNDELTTQGEITLLHSELESARLREQAERQLVKKGIVSALDHKSSQLRVSQLEQRLAFSKQRFEQQKALHVRRVQIEQELLSEYQLSYLAAQEAVEQLQVRAGISGMLQELHVDQGQTIERGQLLALVGSEKHLLADLMVPERDASQILIGQKGVINTFSGYVDARVTRIVPVVREGRIEIEMELLGELPANARPALTIEGKIVTTVKHEALFVQTPQAASAHKSAQLFVFNRANYSLVQKKFQFGSMAGNVIEILSDAQVGDQVVVSDIDEIKHLQTVPIKN